MLYWSQNFLSRSLRTSSSTSLKISATTAPPAAATTAEAVAQRCGAGKAKLAKRRKINRLGLFHRIGMLGGGKAALAHIGGVITDRLLDAGAEIAVALDEFRHPRREPKHILEH